MSVTEVTGQGEKCTSADPPRLTLKQKRFVEEYAAGDGNAVQAYFRAFGRTTSQGKRRSYKGAQKQASLLVSNPIIQAEIQAAQDEYAKRVRVSKAKVIRQVAELAFFDPGDVYEEGPEGMPTPKPWHDIPPAARRAISGVKIKRRRLTDGDDATDWEVEELEYKFAAKGPELDKLCKKLGFYEDTKPSDPAPVGATVEQLVRALAELGQHSGAGPAPAAVGAEPRPAESGLPQ